MINFAQWVIKVQNHKIAKITSYENNITVLYFQVKMLIIYSTENSTLIEYTMFLFICSNYSLRLMTFS